MEKKKKKKKKIQTYKFFIGISINHRPHGAKGAAANFFFNLVLVDFLACFVDPKTGVESFFNEAWGSVWQAKLLSSGTKTGQRWGGVKTNETGTS